jgi:DNA-binding transcriptional MerR regulator
MTIDAFRETAGIATTLGIADVALMSGLSPDTLRWYEREGLVPRVSRGSDRRREYSEREAAFVVMLAKLRDTGMPTEDMREFSRLVAGGAQTHGRRLSILERHRDRIAARQEELVAGLAALNEKAEHYRHLIAAGLDCEGAPVTAEVAQLQAQTTTNGLAR